MGTTDNTKIALEKKVDELINEVEELKVTNLNYEKLTKDIEREKKDLEIVLTVSNAVHQSFDLNYICNIALDMAITLPDIDIALIYLVSEDRKEAILKAHRNAPDDYLNSAERIPYGKGATWKVITSAQVYNMKDLQDDKSLGRAGKELGHRRTLGIPIILEGMVMGVIYLVGPSRGNFSKQEIDLYTAIGNHIGIAIAKARLYDKLEKSIIIQNEKLRESEMKLNNEIEKRKRTEGDIRIATERQELENIVRNILKNENHIDESVTENPVIEDNDKQVSHEEIQALLSEQEYNVMILLASCKSLKEIANEMYLSASTVNTYRARILEKLDLKTTAELIRFAIKNNLTS